VGPSVTAASRNYMGAWRKVPIKRWRA